MSKLSDLLKFNVDAYLKKLNWSRNELARKMDDTSSNISNWLSGKIYPGSEKLQKMSETLGVSLADLFKEDPASVIPNPPHTILDCIKAVQAMKVEETPDHTLSIKMQSHPPPYEPNVLKAIPSEPSKLEYQDPQIQELISLFTTLDESQKTSAIGFIKSLGWASVSTTQDKQKKSK